MDWWNLLCLFSIQLSKEISNKTTLLRGKYGSH